MAYFELFQIFITKTMGSSGPIEEVSNDEFASDDDRSESSNIELREFISNMCVFVISLLFHTSCRSSSENIENIEYGSAVGMCMHCECL